MTDAPREQSFRIRREQTIAELLQAGWEVVPEPGAQVHAADGSADGDRVRKLEEEIAALKNEVADLKEQFAQFRKQFE